MATSKTRIPYKIAIATAMLFIANLRHVCERVEIAGSLRRLHSAGRVSPTATVGDIEILAVPRLEGGQNRFWQRMEILKYAMWEGRDKEGHLVKKAGPKFRKYLIPEPSFAHRPPLWPADIYLCESINWGYHHFLHTGPEGFNRWVVTHESKGGFCPNDVVLDGGHVWLESNGRRFEIAVPEEKYFFGALGLEYVPPHLRSNDVVRSLKRAEVA